MWSKHKVRVTRYQLSKWTNTKIKQSFFADKERHCTHTDVIVKAEELPFRNNNKVYLHEAATAALLHNLGSHVPAQFIEAFVAVHNRVVDNLSIRQNEAVVCKVRKG